MPTIATKPQIVVRGGKPQAIILDLEEYKKLLENANEKEDLIELRKIKRAKTTFRDLKDYLDTRV